MPNLHLPVDWGVCLANRQEVPGRNFKIFSMVFCTMAKMGAKTGLAISPRALHFFHEPDGNFYKLYPAGNGVGPRKSAIHECLPPFMSGIMGSVTWWRTVTELGPVPARRCRTDTVSPNSDLFFRWTFRRWQSKAKNVFSHRKHFRHHASLHSEAGAPCWLMRMI